MIFICARVCVCCFGAHLIVYSLVIRIICVCFRIAFGNIEGKNLQQLRFYLIHSENSKKKLCEPNRIEPNQIEKNKNRFIGFIRCRAAQNAC